MFYRRPTAWKEAAPPASVPASTAMLAADPAFTDREFGSHGELLMPAPSSTVVEPGAPLVIEPWPEEERRRAAAGEPEPAKDELSALDRMRLDADDVDWPDFGPPMVLQPLRRPTLPEPDWRAEERARARPELPLEETPGRYPPPAREAS